jgi:hypothetical protein
MFVKNTDPEWKPYRPLPYILARPVHRVLPNWLRHVIWVLQGKIIDPTNYVDPKLTGRELAAELVRVAEELYH